VGIKVDDPVVCARGRVLLSVGTVKLVELMDRGESDVPATTCPVSITDMPRIRGDDGRSSSTEVGNIKLGVEEFDGGLFPDAAAESTDTGDGGSAVGGSFPSFTKYESW